MYSFIQSTDRFILLKCTQQAVSDIGIGSSYLEGLGGRAKLTLDRSKSVPMATTGKTNSPGSTGRSVHPTGHHRRYTVLVEVALGRLEKGTWGLACRVLGRSKGAERFPLSNAATRHHLDMMEAKVGVDNCGMAENCPGRRRWQGEKNVSRREAATGIQLDMMIAVIRLEEMGWVVMSWVVMRWVVNGVGL